MPSYFVPLSRLFPTDIVPVDLFTLPDGPALFDAVGVTDYRVETTPAGLYFRADLALDPDGDADPTIVVALPQFPDLGLVFSILGRLEIWFQAEFKVRLSMGACVIRLPSELLQPVREADDGSWQADSGREFVEIDIDYAPFIDELPADARDHPIVLSVDRQGRLDLEYPFQRTGGGTVVPIVSLNGPAMIAESGVVFEAGNIAFNFDPEDPTLFFGAAFLRLPPNLLGSVVLPDVLFENATLSRRGFSGLVTASWPLAYENDRFVYHVDGAAQDAELFALQGGLRHISLAFAENRITASDIAGGLVVPYFDEPVDIRLNLTGTGDFTVTLLGVDEDGITLTKEELIALNIQTLTVAREGDLASVVVSGGMEPLLMASDGLEWPRLDVTDLSIEQDITDLSRRPIIKFKEAWLDLKDLATLDLWGFHFELNRVGLGYVEPTDKLWIDLTGSLRLIEHIPVGLGVEGFRLTWPRTLYEMLQIDRAPTLDQALAIASQLEVKFDGVYLFYGVPQAVEFEGFIRFIKEAQKIGFAGDVVLRVPASGFSAEAGLMVGMNFALPYPYPFLYVYLGVELPKGIPLGQSGLALKGALGLLGLNVAPDKTPEQNWYYDWYKRGPFVGAHPTNKWRDEFLAVALGVGITITTTDGYIKGVRGLLVLAIPGPILVIEGRSLILDGLLPAEPPLRALAVLDGREQIVQFNIEAEAELIEDMLDAYGMLEAFFDFRDLTNWHLYLGQDEPRDRRIQANIIKFGDVFLFKADAYLMLDMIGAQTVRARMGVFVGFKPPIPSFGPVQITLDAVLEGDGVVTVLPEQFSGGIDLSANVTLTAFGFGLQMVAGAGVLTEGPGPLTVDAEVHVRAELPLPLAPVESFLPDFAQDAIPELPPLEVEATLQFNWQAPEPPEIVPPLVAATADSPFAPGGGALHIWERAAVHPASVWRPAAENSPVVPVDTRPVLAFAHQMNDAARVPAGAQPAPAFARHPDGRLQTFDAGIMRFTPTLTTVRLYEHRKGEDWPASLDAWKLVASSRAGDLGGETASLPGVWLADTDPEDPSRPPARRLQLWTNNPLLHAAAALGPGYSLLLGLQPAGTSLADSLLDLYPDLHACEFTEPEQQCVRFDTPAPTPTQPRAAWLYHGLRFTHDGLAALTEVGEGRQGPQPRLDAAALRKLHRDLAAIEPFFASLRGDLTVAVLRRWGASVNELRRKQIHRQLPRWEAVWDWLWPAADPGHTCLFLQGARHIIQFPQPVRQLWIRFCRPPDVPFADVRHRLETRRAAHGLGELREIRTEAEGKGQTPNFRACRQAVAHQIEEDGDAWIITAEDGFDCLTLIRLGDFAIAEICYVTAAEMARAAQAETQCATNDAPAEDGHILQPGSYYRLEAETTVAGELREEDLPFGDDPMGAALVELYAPILETLGFAAGAQTYTDVAFFQTEGPPTQLARYMKWTSPEAQTARVFREDDFVLRFLRSNVQAMCAHPPHRLELLVRSVQGRLIDGYVTQWDKASSASLLHEEHLWREHTATSTSPAPDDLLVARRSSAELEPNARYELLVTGSEGGALLFRDRFDSGLSPEVWGPDLAGWVVQFGELTRQGTGTGTLLAGDPGWTDVDMTTEIRVAGSQAAGVLLRPLATPSPAGGDTVWRGCRVVLQPDQQTLRLEGLRREPADGGGLAVNQLDTRAYTAPADAWVRLRVSVVANRVRVWVFDQLVLDGGLYEITADWTGAHRPAGTWLWFAGDTLDAEHQQAVQAGQLAPSAQGATGLYAAGAGPRFRRLQVRDAVLHRVSFTTSAFAGFRELVESGADAPPIDVTATAPGAGLRSAAAQAETALAQARWRWHRDQIDYRFEALDREGLEASRLALRETRAAHDAAFRALAEAISLDLCYLPLAPHVEVYPLRNDGGQPSGLWLRSPESLELRQIVPDEAGQPIGHVGRTTWQLERQVAGNWQVVNCESYHDTDSTQVILLPPPGNTWPSGTYRVRFTYHRDHGDEAGAGDHRYDRPVERRQGATEDEVISVQWAI